MIVEQCNGNGKNQLAVWIRERLEQGLRLLVVAESYASHDGVEDGQYAVEVSSLKELGMNDCDLRWLISHSFVKHLIEMTLQGDGTRIFRLGGALFTPNSCFSLTKPGCQFASEILGDKKQDQRLADTIADSQPPYTDTATCEDFTACFTTTAHAGETLQPMWDADRQELWFCNQLVKRFRIPSPNQVSVLSAFEEEGWPSRIDDPLPPKSEQCPKRRLNDTIRNLNRSQHQNLVRFLGDGSGQGILWEVFGK